MLIEHGEILSDSDIKFVGGCVLVFCRFIECCEDRTYSLDFGELVLEIIFDGLHA